MIIEKCFGIDRETVRRMIGATKGMASAKRGSNRTYKTKVFLFDEYAVLKMRNIRLRNATVQDKDLKYLEGLAETLLALQAKSVNVVPILAFRSDGYVIQPRAKGTELYENERLNDKDYILGRVALLANAPQKHYDRFVADTIELIDAGVLIDFRGKDNFFYHETIGFQFIDLNSHDDYAYGLSHEKPPSKWIAAWNCFLPCYFDAVPDHRETVSELLPQLTDEERTVLIEHNKVIFDKCKAAMLQNGIAEEMILPPAQICI